MNITLLNHQKDLYKIEPRGNYIAEFYHDPSANDQMHIWMFHPAANTVFEISPDRKKVQFVEIVNCIWNCRDVYYATCDIPASSRLELSIYKYQTDTGSDIKICSFIKSVDILQDHRKIRLFLLNESMILMQTETLHQGDNPRNMMGNIDFQLTLYNLDSGDEINVSEANLLNNGIHEMIPVSDSKIMMKTGYSFLEDSRLTASTENNAFIEGVYMITTAKFIADIVLEQDFVDMPLIESAYMDKHITLPKVTDHYTHFCVVDPSNGTSKCVFYQNDSGDRLEYTLNSFQQDDLYLTYVVNHTPYVRRSVPGKVTFLNLKKAESDIIFYDEKFVDQIGQLFLMTSSETSRRKTDFRIYDYPKLNQILKERKEYHFSCCLNGDYYIYC